MSRKNNPQTPARPERTGSRDEEPQVVVVFQGGGSLGAYHIGAYQALEEAGYRPDWVSGISIGAFTAALVVGNAPEKRVERLEAFWQEISWPGDWGSLLNGPARKLYNLGSHAASLLFGQPGFFAPRFPSPLLAPSGSPEALSFYTTAPMRSTLRRFVDFERINSKHVRLSLGATRMSDGELVFFDNTRDTLGPEHVLASGSIPPAFPPTRIGEQLYWDGGCVTNTPLNAILEEAPRRRTLVFMIDLFDAKGPPPRTMDDVNWRAKSIQFASRSARNIEQLATTWNLRRALHRAARNSSGSDPASFSGAGQEPAQRLDIIHITYERGDDQISDSDAEFSRSSIAERRGHGYRDMKTALENAPWTRESIEGMPQSFSDPQLDISGECAVVHRVIGERIHSKFHLP